MPAIRPLRPVLLLVALAIAACAKGDAPATDTAGAVTTDTAAAARAATAAATDDPDRAAAGAAGVPAGWNARTDRATQRIEAVRYVAGGDGVEITTGPAHVLWRAADTASGAYTVRATIEQLEKPEHGEAFGIVLGGRGLTTAAQQYTYVLLRGDGMWSVKARDGATARTVADFAASPAVPTQDASGRARYALAVEVTADSLRVLVDGKRAGAVAKGSLPTDGIVGLRVNHNLHVRVTPPVVTR